MFLFPRRVSCSEKEVGLGEGRSRKDGKVPRRGFREGVVEAPCEGREERLRGGLTRRAGAKGVVPVVERRRQKLDGRMKGDQGVSHVLAGVVQIEAAPEVATLVQEVRHPGRIGPGTGGGHTAVSGMEKVATDGVDGRFAEDDVRSRNGRDGEEAQILAGARGHAAPGKWTGAAQFGADGLAMPIAQEEDGVGSGVGVEVTGLCQRIEESWRQGALLDQIASNSGELVRSGRGQA